MATMPDLVLRDIHQPSAPSWWPPAVGWWWLAAALLVLVCAVVGWRLFRAWRRRRWQQLFDAEVAAAPDAAGRIAAMSSLLRRAARRHRPDADRLHGDEWLSFLDTGVPGAPFTTGDGIALRDGAFRRDAETLDTTALHALARARFIALMLGRRR
ncbi:DUF4381 domain-containing protein [Luteimonas fraxinea]|uniref:DUF4381 domain-containing protein n=1 Tax=Luteimonas fraxinea TaxID=2901869 RepID=A0ABS8UAQ8_9GAMM|nr:DUF4381 domain-containing protein [Luteimonas fraxinea]MCD9095839.1 DUF4381 domain-containing protein [Luteimonas fraxinea]MCD9124428.1 DUF4381 domain-containing protein [Luteimonas fraxinea]UHH10982.1 DUF4381 domain-containing protein [Luteimonas fraxinea]